MAVQDHSSRPRAGQWAWPLLWGCMAVFMGWPALGRTLVDTTPASMAPSAEAVAQAFPQNLNGQWERQNRSGKWVSVGQKSLRTGYRKGWVRYRLALDAWAGQDLIVEGTNPFIPGLAGAVKNASGQLLDTIAPYGARYAYTERPIPYYLPRFLLAVPEEPGACFYLSLQGDGSNRVLPLAMWDAANLAERERLRLSFLTAFMAVLLAVFVFTIAIGAVVSTPYTIPFLVWLVSGALLMLTAGGLGFAYVYPANPTWHQWSSPFWGNMTGAALVLLLQRLYRTQADYPILNRAFNLVRFLLLLYIPLALLRISAGSVFLAVLVVGQESVWLLLAVLLLIAPLAFAARRRDPESPVLFLALAVLAAGVGMEALENLDIVRWNFRTQPWHWAGAAASLFFLSPILLLRVKRRLEAGFAWQGAALLRDRVNTEVLFGREAAVRDSIRQTIDRQLEPRLEEVALGLGSLEIMESGHDVAGIRQRLEQARHEIRTICDNRMPSNLADGSLIQALDRICLPLEANRITVHRQWNHARRLDNLDLLYRQAIFRIAQGLLNNVLKHAQASHAWVDLNMENGSLTLRVADDGIGFDATQTPRHGRGLAIIRQRVEALGGHWTWRARPNGGSTCLVSIPVQF